MWISVRESVATRGSLVTTPTETILQEALSQKADKAYTKRKMALLVFRVSALLKEESDEPSMAKKCLSCDRAFNKLSFKELELAQQVLLLTLSLVQQSFIAGCRFLFATAVNAEICRQSNMPLKIEVLFLMRASSPEGLSQGYKKAF